MNLGPYELNRIYTGDARELARAIPDHSVDFAFVDPPYWVGYDYGNRTDSDMDYIEPLWLVQELSRMCNGYFAITPGIANLYDYPKPAWIASWRKPASTGRNALGGFNVWEPILVYGQSTDRIWQDEFTAPGGQEFDGAFNFCPKPISLLMQLIEAFTAPAELVVDLMVGSGTTAKAAKLLGRNYLAFEIDPDTADLARERVANTQPPLLVLQPEQGKLWCATP